MGNDGEPTVWWHGNRFSKTQRQVWLHWPGNYAGVEWSIGKNGLGAYIQCNDPVVGEEALIMHIQLPFLFSVWLMVQNVPFLKKLPGVKWQADDHGRGGERELSLKFHHGAMWWRLWRNPNVGYAHDWRDSNFNPIRFFLGYPKYSEGPRNHFDSYLEMPEGVYRVSIDIYTAIWKRPRWPWATRITRSDIELKDGVWVPGKGDNGWDMDDDTIYSMTCNAATVAEALDHLRQSVLRDRERYG
jgi:hypothetical protein